MVRIVVIDADARRISKVHYGLVWRTRLKYPRGSITTFVDDGAGREILRKSPLGQRTTSAYDANGRLVLRQDALGRRISSVYDVAGQRTLVRYFDAARATFADDPNGNLTQVVDSTGTTNRRYEPRDLLTVSIEPDGQRLTSTYDAARQRTRAIDPDAGRTTYVFDDASRLKRIVNPHAERTTLLYDAAGRETVQRLANGMSTTTLYDAASRVSRILARSSGGGTLTASFTYTYDPANKRTRGLEGTGDRVIWTYDRTNQLLTERRNGAHAYRHTFTYDGAGNRRTFADGTDLTTDTYDAAGQLTGERLPGLLDIYSATRPHDPVGHRLQQTKDGAVTDYVSDAANRLLTAPDLSGRTTYSDAAAGNQTAIEVPTGDITATIWDLVNAGPAGVVVMSNAGRYA